MIRRLRYILLSYATRPMVWTLAAIYLFLLGATIDGVRKLSTRENRSRQEAYPGTSTWGRTLSLGDAKSIEDFERGRLQSSTATVTISCNSNDLKETAKLLQLLKANPKLRTLTLHSCKFQHDDEGRALAELTQLQFVSLQNCVVPSSLWKQLGQLPELRHLDLTGSTLAGEFPNLESLAHLKTLILGRIVESDVPFVPELRRFPQLETVVLTQYYPARSMQDVKQSAQSAGSMAADPLNDNLKHLQAIPTLRTLFVDEFAPNFRGFSQLQKDLPNVNIRPGLVDVDRQYHLIFLFVLNTAFFLLLAMQIQCHFSQPAARLVPNYAAPHIIPVVCLWLIGIIVHTVLLVNMDATPTAALGVNLLIWGVLCAQGLLDTLAQAVPRLRWIAFLVALALLGTIPFSLFSLPLNRSAIDWYLRGHSPVWTFLFILAGLTASFESLRRSLRLNSIYLERGISSPPLSFSPATQSAWHQEVYWRQTSLSQRREWLVRLFCRRLERAISQAELSGWRQRCNLWIAGNSGQGYLTFSLIVAFMIAFAVGVFAVFGDFPLDDISLQNPMVLAFSIFLPDLPVLVVAGVWRQRRSLFAMESLRPVSRNQFARQIANAIAWDLTPLALVYLAILSWYVIEADPQHWSWWWTGAMLMVFVARWIVVYGLTLWTITIRPNWVLLLAGVTTAYAVTFANLGLIFLQGPVLGVKHLPADLPDIGVASLAGLALGFGIVAWIISRLAYHRWQRIELV